MALTTAISWCDSTWNPSMGCDGCELWSAERRSCYAGVLTERQLAQGPVKGWPPGFLQPTVFPGRFGAPLAWPDLAGTRRPEKPWLDGMPRLVFTVDMGDPFAVGLPEGWPAEPLARVSGTPHRYLILTKKPRRMARFVDRHAVSPNVWWGTSATSQATADSRVSVLADMGLPEGAVRFVSAEPLLEPVNLEPWLDHLDWVIVGGESGSAHRPMLRAWVHDLIGQCRAFGVPVFFKQDSGPHSETLTGAVLPREMPKGGR